MRRQRRPQNETEEHWRLKRLARRALWQFGCWAVALEIGLSRVVGSIQSGYPENGRRSIADAVGVGRIRLPGTQSIYQLGLYVAEAKANVQDLRSGMMVKGGHKHYVVVPEELREAAREIAPKHVGILTVRRKAAGREYSHYRSARGARLQDDAVVPLWPHPHQPEGQWAHILLQLAKAASSTTVGWRYG